jgi:hypothetical protein
MSGSLLIPMPANVQPPAAYVAVAAASQIVTDHHNGELRSQLDVDDDAASIEDVALFSEEGLSMVNAFLDNIIYSILSIARSSSINAIRPAVVDILKAKLARAAIEQAEQELEDLLAGEEEEEQGEVFSYEGNDPQSRWDINRVFKRTRLRLMVYTRLGEMEDEDEEHYIEELEKEFASENKNIPSFSHQSLVSWSSAIFLTSVIEYVAEQTLIVAGQAAFSRVNARNKRNKAASSAAGNDTVDNARAPERVVVEESDVEKIALNSTLGRLWRTWRKRTRGPLSPHSARDSISRASIAGTLYSKRSFDRGSVMSDPRRGSHASHMSTDAPPEVEPTETEIASNIPLPMGDNDVDEIEVPGLANTFEEEEDEANIAPETPHLRPRDRPQSVILLSSPQLLRDATPTGISAQLPRPLSLPPPERRPYEVYRPKTAEEAFAGSASQAPAGGEGEEEEDKLQSEDDIVHNAADEEKDRSETKAEAEGAKDENKSLEPEKKSLLGAIAASASALAPGAVAAVLGGRAHREDGDGDGATDDKEGADDVKSVAASKEVSPVSPVEPSPIVNSAGDIISPSDAIADAELVNTKRVSIEVPNDKPQLVRTPSLRSGRSSTVPGDEETRKTEIRETVPEEPESASTPVAIGIAKTSDVPVAATPTPPPSSASRTATPDGFVQSKPSSIRQRHMSPPAAARKTPSPEKSGDAVSLSHEDPVQQIAPTSAPRERPPTAQSSSKSSSLPPVQESGAYAGAAAATVTVERQPSQRKRDEITSSPSQRRKELNSQGSASTASAKAKSAGGQSEHTASPSSRYSTPEDGLERAALQRVSSGSAATSSASTSILQPGRRSDSSMGRPRGLSGRMSEEDREREFDSLVRGEETVKYTLTPKSMRDDVSCETFLVSCQMISRVWTVIFVVCAYFLPIFSLPFSAHLLPVNCISNTSMPTWPVHLQISSSGLINSYSIQCAVAIAFSKMWLTR